MYPSRSTRFWCCTAVVAALVALWPLTTQTFQFKEVDPSPASDPEWAPVTLIAGQNVRLNLANVAVDNPDYMPGDCQVQVSFLDALGQAIDDPNALEVRPGESATVMVAPDDSGLTRLLRPMIRFIDNPDFRGTAGNRTVCSVVPMMEVFSEETGGTLFLSPAVLKGFNPQPDPPGHQLQGR